MRAVHHHDLRELLLPQGFPGSLDAVFIVVCALGSAAQDDEAVLVAAGLGDGGQTLLGHAHEVVSCGGSANSVDRDGQTAVRAVLEANGEGETRGQLAVQLGLCCARADGPERDEVGQELRGDGVEHLRGNGHAHGREVDEELPAHAEALVDLERLVDVRVVDEALPADCRPGLLEVGAHDDEQVVAELVGQRLQAVAVLQRDLWVVQRAGPDHDEEPVILLPDDVGGGLAAFEHCLFSVAGYGNFGGEQCGRDQWVVSQHWKRSC